MSLTLYAPKSHVNAAMKVELVARFLEVPLEFTRIPFSELKTPDYLKKNPLGKIPTLETPEGCIFESMAIVRYLARRAGKMYGTTAAETAQVDQWFEFFNTQLYSCLMPIVIATFGYRPVTKEQYDEARKSLLEMLKGMDAHLKNNQFLATKDFTLADVVIAAGLRYVFCLCLDESSRSQIPNVTNWFVKTMEHPINIEFFGRTWLCQKECLPNFEFLKNIQTAPKKEEKKKEAPKK